MNLKTVSGALARQVLKTRKNSPAILFVAGVAGVVTTVVLASRATLKLEDILDDAKKDIDRINDAVEMKIDNYSEKDKQKDTITVYAKAGIKIIKLYGPALAVGVASIGALTGSHVILSRRNTALMAAYAALDRGFRQYRQRVIDALGLEKDEEFRHGLNNKQIETAEDGAVVTRYGECAAETSIYARFFDKTCSSWSPTPMYNQLFLRSQQNYANDKLTARGHLFLNEVYEMLGIPHSREGSVVGWIAGNGDNYVDFGIFADRHSDAGTRWVLGHNDSVLLDFNVDGVIWDKI